MYDLSYLSVGIQVILGNDQTASPTNQKTAGGKLERKSYAGINFIHNHPPPAHPRGIAPKLCPHREGAGIYL